MHERAAQRGFTIIELMIVVAIIAVLAIVVIPSFIKESKRTQSQSEVQPMISELSTHEEQYKVEQNAYLAAPACPASVSSTGNDMTVETCAITAGQPWALLRVQAAQSKLKCSYIVAEGDAGVLPSTSTDWPAWMTAPTAAPALSWYFIVAKCPDTEYIWRSWDTKTKSKDGH